jgi:hypothetical protein
MSDEQEEQTETEDVEESDSASLAEEEETPDDKKDLLWAFTKPIDEMTLEEQLEAIKKIRELRKVRVSSSKRKSSLDLILQQLTAEKASPFSNSWNN